MNHLRLIILRELDHFRGWLFLLLALTGLAVLMHLLVLTILPGVRLAEFLVIMKSYVIPGFFGILCGLMGYADSPEVGSHEFRTRPVRLKILYLGKASLIGGIAGALVLVQSVMNWSAGFPLDFWILWWPLVLVGLSFFFLAAILKPTVTSFVQLVVVLVLPVLVAWWVFSILRIKSEVDLSSIGFLTLSFGSACYFLTIFLGKNTLGPRHFWFLALPVTSLVVGGMIWFIPFDRRMISSDALDENIAERLMPTLRLTRYQSGRDLLQVSESKSDEAALHRLRFSNRVVELKCENGMVSRLPIDHWMPAGSDSIEDEELFSALGLIPPIPEEQLAMRLRYSPDQCFFLSNGWRWKIPDEMLGKAIELSTEGVAQYWETRSLGSLPIREGARLAGDDLTVEIVELVESGNFLKLRVHSRSGVAFRLGAHQKNLKQPYRMYGQTKYLTAHDVIPGMSSVDVLKVGIHFDQIEESEGSGFLHLFSISYRGSAPFRSKPMFLDAEETRSRRPLLTADYAILPSIIPIETK